MKHFLEASDPSTDSVFSSSCQGSGLPTQAHLMIRKLPLLSWAAFFLIFTHSLRFTHARTPPRTQAPLTVSPLRADLQYSHISLSSPFSVSVCWKPRAVRGYWCEGLPGATGAPGRVFCSSYVVLLVTGARRARAPPTGLAWEESERGPVCPFGN